MFLIVLFMICLHLSSGAEITNLKIFKDQLNIKEGSKLFIPCQFYFSDDLSDDNHIRLEWRKTTSVGGPYSTVIDLDDAYPTPVKIPHDRVLMNVNHLRHGLCSLTINPAMTRDTGTYEVRVSLDDKLYEPSQRIQVQVRKFSEEFPTATTVATSIMEDQTDGSEKLEPMEDKVTEEPQYNIIFNDAELLKKIKESSYTLPVMIIAGVILVILILGSIAGCYYRIRYYRLKRTVNNLQRDLEKGFKMPLMKNQITQTTKRKSKPKKVPTNGNNGMTKGKPLKKTQDDIMVVTSESSAVAIVVKKGISYPRIPMTVRDSPLPTAHVPPLGTPLTTEMATAHKKPVFCET